MYKNRWFIYFNKVYNIKIIPRSGVCVMLIYLSQSRNCLRFVEPGSSLPCLQWHSICLYSEPSCAIDALTSCFLKIYLCNILPSMPKSLKLAPSFRSPDQIPVLISLLYPLIHATCHSASNCIVPV